MRSLAALLAAALPCVFAAAQAAEPAHLVETQLLNPRIYPDDVRRPVKPPDWELFGFQTHFPSVRGFAWQDGKVDGFQQLFEQRVTTLDLGDVVWPRIDLLDARNLPEVIAEIQRRKLFLFQIWGYVPGAGETALRQFLRRALPKAKPRLRLLRRRQSQRRIRSDPAINGCFNRPLQNAHSVRPVAPISKEEPRLVAACLPQRCW